VDENVEVVGVLALAVPNSGGRICPDAAVAAGLVVAGRDEADINLCPGAAVTASELVLTLAGVDSL